MAKRKINPASNEIKNTLHPIGEDVPKAGIPVSQPKKGKKKTGNPEELFQKDDGFGPKIGPKGVMHKIDASSAKGLPDLSAKMAGGGKFNK
ncbi:hypothetical protein Aoki45_17440 [Algoriphagus sp. oki45]|uniref:hypothetical protein n=1 Tax=Algoriphagus sp. oki45 TaxID=3067294 RepID=UPI0027E6E405|nr:hypothetical protein Aoki45_17440 [Algoriphagus sp. oki45]